MIGCRAPGYRSALGPRPIPAGAIPAGAPSETRLACHGNPRLHFGLRCLRARDASQSRQWTQTWVGRDAGGLDGARAARIPGNLGRIISPLLG